MVLRHNAKAVCALRWKRHPNPKRLETNNQCEISLHSSWNITDYCMTHHQNHYRDILGNTGKYGIVRQIPGSGHKISTVELQAKQSSPQKLPKQQTRMLEMYRRNYPCILTIVTSRWTINTFRAKCLMATLTT